MLFMLSSRLIFLEKYIKPHLFTSFVIDERNRQTLSVTYFEEILQAL